MKLERLLRAIASVGPTKAKALASSAATDVALPYGRIAPEKRRRLAANVRGFAEKAARRPWRPTRSPRAATAKSRARMAAANRVRFAQIDALRIIADAGTQEAGAAAAAHLLRTRASEPDLRTLKVSRILQAIDQVGPGACGALLAEFHLPLSTRLSDLEARQVGALAARLTDKATPLVVGGRLNVGRPALRKTSDRDHACQAWLSEYLAGGSRAATDVKAASRDAGYGETTLRHAKRTLQVEHIHVGGYGADGHWTWRLPDEHRLRSFGDTEGTSG